LGRRSNVSEDREIKRSKTRGRRDELVSGDAVADYGERERQPQRPSGAITTPTSPSMSTGAA